MVDRIILALGLSLLIGTAIASITPEHHSGQGYLAETLIPLAKTLQHPHDEHGC